MTSTRPPEQGPPKPGGAELQLVSSEKTDLEHSERHSARLIGWRVLAKLEFEQPDIAIHRSVMVALDRFLIPFRPVTYREAGGITLSFEINDASQDSRDLAGLLLQRALEIAPTTRLASAEIHQVDRDAAASSFQLPPRYLYPVDDPSV